MVGVGAFVALLAMSCATAPSSRSVALVVDSVADVVATDGSCTLREAIVAANTDLADADCGGGAGADHISFRLDGPADFVVAEAAGYTIRPSSQLPALTAPVTIDGYSQPGARPNRAASPGPLDGRLLVQLEGSVAGPSASGLVFAPGSDGSSVRGLVIGGFGVGDRSGNGIVIDAADVAVQGDYIGTDPTGTLANGNGFAGFTSSPGSGARGERIGGTHPSARNLISGNGSSAGYPHSGAVIQGNYIGTDVTGSRALPNASVSDAGALSIDEARGVTVGGDEPGATNLVSGNASYGLAPEISPELVIAGNLIGTDWTGRVPLPNTVGIIVAGDQTGSVIGGGSHGASNLVSGNLVAGIVDGSTGGLHVVGNTVGLDLDAVTPIPNAIGVALRSDAVVGGPGEHRNVISGNTAINVLVKGFETPAWGATVLGNLIGTAGDGTPSPEISAVQGAGVWVTGNAVGNVIGGAIGNRIAGNRGFGVGVSSFVDADGTSGVPTDTLVVGNEIFGTTPGPTWPGSTGLAIDLFSATDTTQPVHPLDPFPEELSGLGPGTVDPDGGPPASGVPSPTITSAELVQRTLTVRLDLAPGDVGLPTQQRIDVYLNLDADPGAARLPVGYAVVETTGDRVIELQVPAWIDPDARWVTATVTRLGADGAGSTGELSVPAPVAWR